LVAGLALHLFRRHAPDSSQDHAGAAQLSRGGSFRFAPQGAEGWRVFRYVVGQEFQRNKLALLHILSLVDHTHPAAELLDGAVVRDGPADHWRESYFGETGKSTKAEDI
jgi:hypothetical protein